MPVDTEPYTLGAAQGLDQRWKGKPGVAQTAQDLVWDPRGGWRTGPGYRRILKGQPAGGGGYTNPFTALGQIWSLHRFAQSNGARWWLLFEADLGSSSPTTATFYALNPSDRTGSPYTALVDRSGNSIASRTIVTTPWQRTQSVTWNGRIYLVNGIDTPRVFDGTMCDRAGFSGPPAAPIVREISNTTATYYDAINGNAPIPDFGIGPLPASTTDPSYTHQRRYVVTFLNSRGQESPPSEASNTVSMKTGASTITMGRNFHWLEVPVGGDEVVARRIYATENIVDASGNTVLGRADVFMWLMDIEDNATKGLEIHQDDGYLGGVLDVSAFGAWPTNVTIMCSFKGTLFAATSEGSEVVYSAAGFPEVFPPANRITIGDASLGPITGMFSTHNAVVVLKQSGVYLVKGDPTTGFACDLLDPAHGCASPRSVVQIPNVGFAWVGRAGIYALQGSLENEGIITGVRNIGLPLYEDVRRWNTSALLNAVAVHDSREMCVRFFIPTVGEVNPKRCISFSYEVGQWTSADNFPVSCAVSGADHNGYVFFGSHDTSTNPGIHVLSRGFSSKGASGAIEPVYETQDLDFGALFRTGSLRSVMVYCVGYGDNDLTLDYKTARRLTYVRADEGDTAQTEDQQYPEHQNRMKVYGAARGDYVDQDGNSEVAIWDTDTWGVWRPIVVRFDVSVQNVAPIHEFAARFAPATGTTLMQVLSIDLELHRSELRKAKPFSTLGANGGA